jgi:hypothetical protein
MAMKKLNEIIGNRTRALPACNTVPQRTALPRAAHENSDCQKIEGGRALGKSFSRNEDSLSENEGTYWMDVTKVAPVEHC